MTSIPMGTVCFCVAAGGIIFVFIETWLGGSVSGAITLVNQMIELKNTHGCRNAC